MTVLVSSLVSSDHAYHIGRSAHSFVSRRVSTDCRKLHYALPKWLLRQFDFPPSHQGLHDPDWWPSWGWYWRAVHLGWWIWGWISQKVIPLFATIICWCFMCCNYLDTAFWSCERNPFCWTVPVLIFEYLTKNASNALFLHWCGQFAARPTLHSIHGQRWSKYQRFTVFYYHSCHPMVGQ